MTATTIEKLAEKYNNFQAQFGLPGNQDLSLYIGELFSPNLQKVINGKTLVFKRDALVEQLNEVKDSAVSWKLIIQSLIPSKDDIFCTIRYFLHTENSGDFDIVAIISSQDGIQIDKIDEIYYYIA